MTLAKYLVINLRSGGVSEATESRDKAEDTALEIADELPDAHMVVAEVLTEVLIKPRQTYLKKLDE